MVDWSCGDVGAELYVGPTERPKLDIVRERERERELVEHLIWNFLDQSNRCAHCERTMMTRRDD